MSQNPQKPHSVIDVLPDALLEKLAAFLLDKKVGNIRINFRDGKILGIHAEEIIAVK